MNRWKAFAIHLGASALVFLVLLLIIINVWFPGILISIDGGWDGLKILLGVDVVLGPLLTLLVYKAGKPGLKFDLTCIATLQIACLVAGLSIVYRERPIALVLAYDTIYSLAGKEFADYGKDPALLENFNGSYPKLLYVELPENSISADIANLRSQFIGDPLFIQTEKFREIPDNASEVFRRVTQVRDEASLNLQLESEEVDCLLARFMSTHTSGFVCFDPERRLLTRFYQNPGEP